MRISLVPPTVLERTYIRVTGKVSYSEQKPFVVAFRVDAIKDPNEIPEHFLQVINDSLFLEKRKNVTVDRMNKGDMAGTSNVNRIGGNNNDGYTQLQRRVMNILSEHKDSPAGLKRIEIHNYMTGVDPSQIDDAIQFLANEGHIFSTIDEDTFKAMPI